MIKPFIISSSTSWSVPVDTPAVSPSMVTMTALLNMMTPVYVCASAGSSAPFADAPTHYYFPHLSLTHKSPRRNKLISADIPSPTMIFHPLWITHLPSMKAVSAPLFAVFTCTGNSVCSPKTYLSYLIQYLSNGAFLPSTGSSCRLKALRIFYF